MGSTCPVVIRHRRIYYGVPITRSKYKFKIRISVNIRQFAITPMKYLSSLKNKNLSGKITLLRLDLNIADSELKNKNHPRLAGSLPTIEFLIKRGAEIIILSHRGRPKGIEEKYSLKPLAGILSKLLKKPVRFINFNTGASDVLNIGVNFGTSDVPNIKNSPSGSVFILENLRFLPGEEKNDKKFAKQLASLGDFYVNDAFAVSHRANASVEAITRFLPSYAGLLMEKEIENLNKAMKKPRKPFVIILGGAKISDKLGIIKNFKKRADKFLIGGGIANTFLVAEGLPIGDSIFEEKMVSEAKKFLKSPKIILPVDYAIENKKIFDIGPQTVENYTNIIKKAKTIIWNGPMGYFENPKFAKASKSIAKAVVKNKAFAVIGGGETTAIVSSIKYQVLRNIFVSTGGGAMLEYLAGKKLPGITALK